MGLNKVLVYIITSIILSGCAQSTAMLGPALTLASTGNASQAGMTFFTNKVVEKVKNRGWGSGVDLTNRHWIFEWNINKSGNFYLNTNIKNQITKFLKKYCSNKHHSSRIIGYALLVLIFYRQQLYTQGHLEAPSNHPKPSSGATGQPRFITIFPPFLILKGIAR